ncbi:MAG: 3-isopropylmalate dehydratase large subunit [Desulfitobacteriaceae bacterium]|nr:3-isopropylmalate dehydratase large subunit [Desulfitobacteriaceae bacterium]
MHALEKILAKASGRKKVQAGDIVTVAVDVAGINDLYLQVLQSFTKIGLPKVWDPDKVVFFFDHYAPAPTIKSASNQKEMRDFANSQGIKHVFDINSGVCHQVLVEAGLSLPGKIVVITDSHSTTHGALGAFGTGVGATDQAAILATGQTWMMVPEIISMRIEGEIPKGVSAKDIVLKIVGELGPSVAAYKGVEYLGETVKQLPLAERMVLCNMAVELGAKTAYIQPNQQVLEYLDAYQKDYELFETDPGFKYQAEYVFDVENLKPQVALPHSIDNVVPVEESGKKRIHQAFIGTCTGGRLADIKAAAEILKGKKIADGTRLIIMPASTKVLMEAINKGYLQALLEAGATFSAPGCGPCLGTHQGILAPGETCITTSSRNFPGRMGSTEAEVYVASPATVAASALKGYLCDPREWMK